MTVELPMGHFFRLSGFFLTVLVTGLGTAAQTDTSKSGYRLLVTGDVTHELHLSLKDLAKLGKSTAALKMHDGKVHLFEGALLTDVLAKAGFPMRGKAARGKALATYFRLDAPDGYRVVLGWGEVDPTVSGRKMVLALAEDGKPLNAKYGPLCLAVDHDLEPSRSIRMVSSITVVKLRK